MINVTRFTASYCGPCKALAPEFKKFEEQFSDVKFVTIDVQAQSEMAELYKVRTVPTVIIEKNGTVVDQLVGLQSRQKYISAISDAINKDA